MTTSASTRPTIAVLLAAFNRRDLTLRALRTLAAASADTFAMRVVLLDDASTDGTEAAVLAEFPDTVVLKGDGSAFWNGGMFLAWQHALGLGVDGYLWLNDDVALDGDALERLRTAWDEHGGRDQRFVLVGATRGNDGRLTYGGQRRVRHPFGLKFERLPLADHSQRCDTFNGNIVLIPQATVDAIGINDPGFFHALGDIDYGLRASRAGIPVVMLPGTLGVCETNPPFPLNRGPWAERWRRVNSHRGLHPASWWRITRRYSGVWLPFHFLLPYRKLFGKQG